MAILLGKPRGNRAESSRCARASREVAMVSLIHKPLGPFILCNTPARCCDRKIRMAIDTGLLGRPQSIQGYLLSGILVIRNPGLVNI